MAANFLTQQYAGMSNISIKPSNPLATAKLASFDKF